MKLLSLHVENFGTLHDYDLSFTDGLNVLLHPNGWGKSTLAVFVKAMLYGLPASTRRSIIENERKRYTPWQGGPFGGSLDIEIDGHPYRLERTFGGKESEDTLSVISLESGRECDADWASDPGTRLFGVNAAAFERSTYLSQRATNTSDDPVAKEGSVSIQTKLNRLVDATDDLGNYDAAMAALDKRRQYYRHLKGDGGAIPQKQQELSTMDREIEQLRAQKDALALCRTRVTQAEQQAAQLQAELSVVEQQQNKLHSLGELRAIRERLDAVGQEERELFDTVERSRAELGGKIPSEDMIRQLHQDLQTIQEAKQLLNSPDAAELSVELTAHEQRFALGLPTKQALQELRDIARAYHQASTLADSLERTNDEPPAATQHAVEQCLVRLNAYEQQLKLCRTQLDTQDTASKGTPPKSLIIPSVAGSILALAALIGGVWQPRLLWVGVGLGLITLIFAFVTFHRRGGVSRSEAENLRQVELQHTELKEQIKAEQARLNAAQKGVQFASLWHEWLPSEAVPAPSDAVWQTELLAQQCDRFRSLSDKRAELQEQSQKATLLLQRAQDSVDTLLATLPGAPKDGARALYWLTEQRGRLLDAAQRYDRKHKELQELRAQYDTDGKDFCALEEQESLPDERQLADEKQRLGQALASLADTLLRERQQAQRLERELDRLDELEHERARLDLQIQEQSEQLDAIVHAQKYLKEAREQLSGRYLSTMKEHFAHYMQLLTGESAPVFTMDERLRVKLRQAGSGRDTDCFSVGIRDLIALCERLSLVDAMFEDERPFLMLDDPFTNLDDETVARAHRLLDSIAQKYQVIYLTCNSSRTPQK